MPLLTLPIRDLRIETPRTRRVILALDAHPFSFSPGQAIWLGRHGQALRKPYSIACSPEQARADDALELLIQVGADGSAGAHLDSPAPGLLVDVEGPVGSFRFPPHPAGDRFVFVAGGTGIAPLRAMLWHALIAFPDRRCSLVYSARSAAEFAYGSEMRELARAGRILLIETVTREPGAGWTGARGRITRDAIADSIRAHNALCFVCGPPALVEDVTGWLRDLGVPPEQILAEGSG